MAEIDIAPHFGAELKDGFKSVNGWISNGIGFLDDVQQFYRERSAIEKEYSTKLSALAKKYHERKAKKSSSLSVGDSPTVTPGSLESASMTTWTVQLNTLEARASEHDVFSSELIMNLAEPLKHLSNRCEELRKQHAEYATKLEKERDASYAELKRVKGKYDSVCQEVENRRKKTESSFDSSRTKAQNAYQQQQADMYNAKNTYLIAINVTNKQKERYYHGYVPDLIDSLQDLAEFRVSKLNSIWTQAASIEMGVLGRSRDLVQHWHGEIPRNKPVLDSMMFVRHNAASWQEPFNFGFEPSPVWHDDDTMSSTATSKVFLQNILGRSKGQLKESRAEVERQKRELEGARMVKQRIREGKDKRDEVDISKATFAVLELFHDAERKKVTAEVEVSTILLAVGDVTLGARSHNFKSQTFKIPTNCDLCGERIWGLSAKGFDCRDCGFTCHSKCEMKVPADCPGEQDKDEKRQLKAMRQERSRGAQPIEEQQVAERPSAAVMPALNRTETMNSMNTLSSGYAASANRSVSGFTQPLPDDALENHKPNASRASVSAPSPARPRVLAPPPMAYINSNGNGTSTASNEKRGKMMYAYQQNAAGEISVNDGREVIILELDDGSGWLKVRVGLDEGLVPASYVETTGPTSPSDIARPGSTHSTSSLSLPGSISGSMNAGQKKIGPAVAPKRGAKKLKYVEAMYEYAARSENEHSMAEGERFVLISRDGGDGWAEVEKGGVVKSVPASYVQDV